MSNAATARRLPYRLTVWSGDYVEIGCYATFAEALAAYAALDRDSKQIANLDHAGSGSSGLTEDEIDQWLMLPSTRAATPAELAAVGL